MKPRPSAVFSLPVLLFAAVALLGSLPASAAGVDYYRWRGPNLDGISPETSWLGTWPVSGPKQLWKAAVGIGFSSVSIRDGRAYTMGNEKNQNTVFCFDAVTGKEIWKQSYPCKLGDKYYEGGTHSTPTVEDGKVFTVGKYGDVHCFDAANGTVVWQVNLQTELGAKLPEWGFAGSVLIHGDHAVVNIGKYGTALDKNTGKVVWKTGTEAAGYSTHVPFKRNGKEALAVFGAKNVAAVDPSTGATVWEFPWKTSYDVNAVDAIVHGDKVFVSSGYNRGGGVIQLADSTPTLVWENKNMRNHMNSCVLIQDKLYGFDESELKCLDFATGKVLWKEESLGKGALMASDGKLIVISEKGELVIAPVDPAGFKPVARAQILGGKCWTTPVLSHGRVYARNAKGDLVCVDVKGN